MIEVLDPPLYFAWRWEHGFPYVVHFYVAEEARTFAVARHSVLQLRKYFQERGFRRVYLNARLEDVRIQKAIQHHFRVKPYGEADGHVFYLVEV